LENTDEFMGSSNIRDIAIRSGLWKPQSADELPNFQKLFSVPRAHPEYVSRRVWRIFDMVAPHLNLSSTATMFELPFSVKPEKLVSVNDIMNIQRDHYEGTKYDLTQVYSTSSTIISATRRMMFNSANGCL
jgi:dipeptidase